MTDLTAPAPIGRDRATVVNAYAAFDRFYPACGLFDLTEGIYNGDPSLPYEEAQANQRRYLLDQIRCGPGSRVLDVGCGYGTVIDDVRARGGSGAGITLSEQQVARCRAKGLDVHRRDYRDLPSEWHGAFDGVVANGSIEHFVSPQDAAAGRADELYRELFAIAHRQIDPASPARRFVTTTIHGLRRPANPLDVTRSPFRFRPGSDAFHWALLQPGLGGYYPALGQFERCAAGYFELVEEVDGTEDYFLTSEEWARRVRRTVRSARGLRYLLCEVLPALVRYPVEATRLLMSGAVSGSWTWQFRPPDPPTCLLRQTWEYVERA